jgi:hypothetical protein
VSIPRILAAVILGAGTLARPIRSEDGTLQKVLIPVFAEEPVPGVNGSSWITDLWVSNSGDSAATVAGVVWDCSLPECNFPAPFDPEVTMSTGTQAVGGLQGTLIYVETATADDVSFGLRFRDLSRQATTWGTELPVPREAAFRNSRFSLVDVPVTPGFRQTLRVYEIDGTPRVASVRIRAYRLNPSRTQPFGDPDELLGETDVPLAFTASQAALPEYPGYAQVTDLSTFAPLGDVERLRLEVEPVTPGLRLWAFVTVIHNETQHATVITPQ